ncbi:hypothetical protein L3Q65_18810 [Amycolatopsis sp. FU40]|uniref:hypothetical protein n=1 Tax=Amycolatopsis sp. FU40 TaxID=2914159 RepID=UPI001F395B32|nr:hypothetical protein [Amycolatopsis sp. FU40]UKD58689.1 hypothetical protein L3Q65_18810 [Amycolatopsis sp. FU40]
MSAKTVAAAALAAATAIVPAAAAAEMPPTHRAMAHPPGEPPVHPYRDMGVRIQPHLPARQVGEVWAGFTYGWDCWTTGDPVEISHGRYNNVWLIVYGYQNVRGYVPAAGLSGDKYGNWVDGSHIQDFPCRG